MTGLAGGALWGPNAGIDDQSRGCARQSWKTGRHRCAGSKTKHLVQVFPGIGCMSLAQRGLRPKICGSP